MKKTNQVEVLKHGTTVLTMSMKRIIFTVCLCSFSTRITNHCLKLKAIPLIRDRGSFYTVMLR